MNWSRLDQTDATEDGVTEKDDKTGSPQEPVEQVSCFQRLRGMIMILCGGIMLLGTSALAKHLKHLGVGEYIAIRFFFMVAFIFPIVFFQEREIDTKGKLKYILLRCVFGSIAGMCKFTAVVEMEYGNAISLFACGPLFAAIFSRILWKEKISVYTIISLILGLCGITLIARPRFIFGGDQLLNSESKSKSLFVLVPVLGSVLFGLSMSLLRKVGKEINIMIVPLYLGIVNIPANILYHIARGDPAVLPDCHLDRVLLLAAAGFSIIGHVLINRGLSIEKSGPGALCRNVDMVFAYVLQVVLFHEPLETMSVAGALLILASTFLIAIDKLVLYKYRGCEI